MNKHQGHCILSVNGGSSSIKFSFYKIEEPLKLLFNGQIENIGTKKSILHVNNGITKQIDNIGIEAADHQQAVKYLVAWLEKQEGFSSLAAIGHRIVHGMKHTEPELITNDLLADLQKISAFDPEHLPEEIKLIEVFRERYPSLPQVACFDTAFHTSMPQVAKLLSIPRRYYDMGIQRYGFHGLSYTYLIEELHRIAGKEKAKGKIILAHLGNGASLAAVKEGKVWIPVWGLLQLRD